MAQTIYFLDGSRELLAAGDNERLVLERIIRERLGDDTAELFLEIAEANIGLEEELKSCEKSCHDYYVFLEHVRDSLHTITGLLFDKKASPNMVQEEVLDLIHSINNKLE